MATGHLIVLIIETSTAPCTLAIVQYDLALLVVVSGVVSIVRFGCDAEGTRVGDEDVDVEGASLLMRKECRSKGCEVEAARGIGFAEGSGKVVAAIAR